MASDFPDLVSYEGVARIIRGAQEQWRAVAERVILDSPADGIAVVGKVTDGGSFPTVAGAVYLLTLQDIDVEEAEGSIATFIDEEGIVPALNIGTNIPTAGLRVIASSISGKWVFEV